MESLKGGTLMKPERKKHFLWMSLLYFLLCGINLYLMDFKLVNLLLGIFPFFIAGVGNLYAFVFRKNW